jgi:hypothetical protein
MCYWGARLAESGTWHFGRKLAEDANDSHLGKGARDSAALSQEAFDMASWQ